MKNKNSIPVRPQAVKDQQAESAFLSTTSDYGMDAGAEEFLRECREYQKNLVIAGRPWAVQLAITTLLDERNRIHNATGDNPRRYAQCALLSSAIAGLAEMWPSEPVAFGATLAMGPKEARQIRTVGETADERIDAIDSRNSAAYARSMAAGIEAEVTQ